ncbi:hypothetical protein BCR44DRAFT_1457459 [Catenaria anguillulae PL171]|uniref:Protein kinase domain-containing protein n=1 Tax=Catenaria anguillulae PL171 TaxID=765915 RepID=A0A1Y2I658_9FUNG|nr:hypothetical protein BCR44DRAFT_1457459 [Catenaria anguillulae PL171]
MSPSRSPSPQSHEQSHGQPDRVAAAARSHDTAAAHYHTPATPTTTQLEQRQPPPSPTPTAPKSRQRQQRQPSQAPATSGARSAAAHEPTARPYTHRAGVQGHDSTQLRRDWLIMLQSVLTGDILRRETQRWTEPDKKYALWLALRAVSHGHSVDEERRIVDAKRLNVDRIIDDVLDFAADPTQPLHSIRSQAMRVDHPRLGMPECQAKVDIMQTWLNMVTELEITTNVFKQWSGLAFVDVSRSEGSGRGAQSTETSNTGWSPPKSRPGTIRIVDFHSGDGGTSTRVNSGGEGGSSSCTCPNSDTSEIHDSANPSKILESLLRGHELQMPLERRFVHQLPNYLRRLKATVIDHADRFNRFRLPIPTDRIRLAYADKICDVTLPTLEQLLSDFKATMVVASKVRQEFLDFFAPQPGWAPHTEGSRMPDMDVDLFRSVHLYFRLLEMILCMEPNRIKEYEILDAEWQFCGSLLLTGDPIPGLDAFMVDSFSSLVVHRFQQLRDLYMEVIKGAVKLNQCLDTLKMRSRHAKMFFRDISAHVLRAVPLVLVRPMSPKWEVPDETDVLGPWTAESHALEQQHLPHRYQFDAQLQPQCQPSSPHELDAEAIAAGTAPVHDPIPHARMVAFIQRLFDTGFRLVGHTEHQVYFFSRNPAVNVLDFLCAVPCNRQALSTTHSVIMVHFPTAPSLFMCSPLISPRIVVDAAGDSQQHREQEQQPAQQQEDSERRSRTKTFDRVASSMLPSEMLAPILLVANSADAVPAACEEFQDLVPPTLHGRGLALTRKLHVAMSELEANIARYAFSLLNGVALVKEKHDDSAMESLYMFASDFALRFSRMVHNPRRLLHRLLMFTVDWIKFTCAAYAQHQQGQPNRKTFRWALLALEFTLNLCRGCNLFSSGFSIPVSSQPDHGIYSEAPPDRSRSAMYTYRGGKVDPRVLHLLTDSEFHSMRVAVGHCMALLISHFESFSPQLTWADTTSSVPSAARFFAGTQAKMIALEARRTESMRANRLIGRVLDRSTSEQSLASLSSSQSSVSIRWQHGKFLGGGTFGSVYMGINLSTGELMAVKEIRIHNTTNFASLKRMVQDEMRVMEKLAHPNVVQYFGIEVHRDKVFLFMEYCAGGRLSNLVSEGGLEEPVIKRLMYQICLGLQYLHSLKVVHRDVKPDNILLDAAGNVKLVDFGAAKILSNQRTVAESASAMSLIGTPNYLAPETVVGSSSGGHVGAQDIWSLGCVLLELYTGRPPWSHLDNQWAIIYHCAFSPPPIPDSLKVSPDGLDFLKSCLQVNPRNRPTASELLAHPFLAEEAAKDVSPAKPPLHRLISTLHAMPIPELAEEDEEK